MHLHLVEKKHRQFINEFTDIVGYFIVLAKFFQTTKLQSEADRLGRYK